MKRKKRKRQRYLAVLVKKAILLIIFLSFGMGVYFAVKGVETESIYGDDNINVEKINSKKEGESEIEKIKRGVQTNNLPVILQNPELPSGCESTAAVMLLNAYGFAADKEEFASALPWCELESHNGRLYACHPDREFVGSPYSTGYGVFSGAVAETMQSFIDKRGGNALVKNVSGSSEQTVLEYINQGTPVCVWVTMDLREIQYKNGWYIKEGDVYTDEYFQWPGGEHCVLLTGYGSNKVIVHDPLLGKAEYDRDLFFERYREMGSQAVIIEEE